MPWQQLTFQVDKQQADLFSDALHECGAASVSLQDAADQPLFEPGPGETPLWQHVDVVGMFAEDTDIPQILGNLKQQLDCDELPRWQLSELQDQDWVRVWMDDFKPIQFADNLWICPSWMTPLDEYAVNIILDPGLAFGSGTHPTTAMCLQWLGNTDLTGKTVIDYGCGSGVLAVAAALLGAATVWAIDNDPQALQATEENARNNKVSERIHYGLPDALPAMKADIIVANIIAGPLIELAPLLAAHHHADGELALSGILETQVDSVRQCYQQWYQMDTTTQQQEWCRLTGTHHGDV